MKTTDRIIDQYRQGDFENRLNLYLECPSLRDEFNRIDLAETDQNAKNGPVEKPQPTVPETRIPWIRSLSISMKRCWHHCRMALAR